MSAGGQGTVLVVDDQRLVAGYLVDAAAEGGWTAEAACTVEEFEGKLDSSTPEVIVLDLAMPGCDGVEMVRHLARRDYTGSLLFLSGCDKSVIEASAHLAKDRGLNVVGFAQKPVTIGEFNELLDRAR